MKNKNRLLFSLLIFAVVTVVWYFVLDAKTQASADLCAVVDCLPQGELTWPLLFGSGCCGSLTTFRWFITQLLQLLATGVILAGVTFVVLRKGKQ